MKAMVCEAFGGPEVLAWRDLPDPPAPGLGEIQVRIRARGVQYVDVLMLAGKYQFRPEPPFIPGGEAAGEVVAVGPDVTDLQTRRPRHVAPYPGCLRRNGQCQGSVVRPRSRRHEPGVGGRVPRRLFHGVPRACCSVAG